VTLNWNKLYVAAVTQLPPHESFHLQWASMTVLPALSGYRDKDTREVRFTDDYSATLLDYSADPVLLERMRDSMQVTIRMADVISVVWWDPVLWKTFQERKALRTKEAAR
jgi:hypothetical protein